MVDNMMYQYETIAYTAVIHTTDAFNVLYAHIIQLHYIYYIIIQFIKYVILYIMCLPNINSTYSYISTMGIPYVE